MTDFILLIGDCVHGMLLIEPPADVLKHDVKWTKKRQFVGDGV